MCGFVLSSFICISSWALLVNALSSLPDVEKYEVISPRRLNNAREKRSLSTDKRLYSEELRYALTIEGRNYTLHLEKNRNLLGKDYTETHYLKNGTEVTSTPNLKDHCYYQGHIQGMNDSSASVEVCSGIRGLVRAGQKLFLIEPLGGSGDGEHALYRQEHLRRKRSACREANRTVFDKDPKPAGFIRIQSWRSAPVVKGPKYVELFLVVDNTEYKQHNKDMSQIRRRMMDVTNHIDKLYRTINIRVMLVGLEVWTDWDKIDVSTDPDKTLTRFLEWRKNVLLKKKRHDNAHFVTGISFVGSTVGLANKFAMCTINSAGVNEDHNPNSIGLASTIAHEMGHNLGMSHDTESCYCEKSLSPKGCVMAPSVGDVFPQSFSSCSQQELESFLNQISSACLNNVPSAGDLFGGPECGNMFLEPGEECDCGTVEECRNPCCNATTCRLTEGAQCAQGECCQACKLKPAGVVCRKSAGDCDLDDFCSGLSAECPKDDFKMNGLPCENNQGYCFNGQCPTHLQHCQILWGPGAQVAPDLCFKNNQQGNLHLFCKKTRYGPQPCAQEDVKCGKIHCTGGSDLPVTQSKYVLTMSWPQLLKCNVAEVTDTEAEDIGLVPTGTKCGDNKVCYGNACKDIAVYGTKGCSEKCNNHGVCNHERKCHCDPGWAPPYCDVKLSELPQGGSAVVIAVSVVVTILVLLPLIVGGLICCRRGRKEVYSTKKRAHSASGLSNPLFHGVSTKSSPRCAPPRISTPTFLESSASPLPCAPLRSTVTPSRAPPQPPPKIAATQSAAKSSPIVKPSQPPPLPPPETVCFQAKPPAPKKPLPDLSVKQVAKPNSAPPVPPVKPPGSAPHRKQPQVAGKPKTALMPPVKPR
ncbi:disintegrin and metalloproteinase domain-containing protein 8 [Lepisosteus oculatus]|uniref:disintegrin and metalloproteinase domain-containing protein 8 n=1 Tax=Lepisosteus oculatus TaxID=7918 RepID=UPI00371E21B6